MAGETPSPNGNPGPAGPEVPGKSPPPSGPGAGVDLRERLDQMGTILAKGLDLAEAGVSLGVTILNRVSSGRPAKDPRGSGRCRTVTARGAAGSTWRHTRRDS